MNRRLRSAMLLAATLVVGIVIGAAGSREIARLWLPGGPPRPDAADAREDGGHSSFVATMERAIEPRDSAQRAAVRAIVERTAQTNRVVIQSANAALRAAVDSMRVQLEPVLDATQRARLEEAMRRLPPIGPRRGPPGAGRPNGPPGAGPPQDGPPQDGPPPDRPPPRGAADHGPPRGAPL